MKKLSLLLLGALMVCPLVFSQAATAAAPAIASATRAITLDNSVVALDDIWKFQPGDSPWVNGAPEWAQPGYDDSHWAAMDLTPDEAGAVDMQFGTKGFVPEWTRKGFPSLSGYAWYRLRVRIADASQPLWLKMPMDFDDGYQIYANGHYVGECGGFAQQDYVRHDRTRSYL